MCMSPDVETPPPVEPAKPPAPPAPPATQTSAQSEQSAPEKPGNKEGPKRKKGRNSLRIPKNRSRGLNLPGSGGGDK